jgi:hypothetical protein
MQKCRTVFLVQILLRKPRSVGILKARQSYEALNEHDRKILTEQRATAAQKTTAQR